MVNFRHRPRLWKRSLRGACIALAVTTLAAAQGYAQQAPPVPAAPAGARPLWTEALITAAMAGLALFAICRNSNRT